MIIYARVATHSQIKSKGCNVDESGYSNNFVQLNLDLERMKVRGIEKLLTLNPSRISRTSLGLSTIQKRFAEDGDEIEFL